MALFFCCGVVSDTAGNSGFWGCLVGAGVPECWSAGVPECWSAGVNYFFVKKCFDPVLLWSWSDYIRLNRTILVRLYFVGLCQFRTIYILVESDYLYRLIRLG